MLVAQIALQNVANLTSPKVVLSPLDERSTAYFDSEIRPSRRSSSIVTEQVRYITSRRVTSPPHLSAMPFVDTPWHDVPFQGLFVCVV